MFDTEKKLVLSLALLLVNAPIALAQLPATDAEPRSAITTFTLGAEDQVRVWIWEEATLSSTATVRPDGRISLPLVGSVAAAGLTPEELQQDLVEQYRAYLDTPTVVVIVEAINSRNINVFGQVNNPGRYPLLQQLTILDVIAMAGGFTEYANMGNVIVIRNDGSGVRQYEVDVKRIFEDEGDIFSLQPGDTVYVK